MTSTMISVEIEVEVFYDESTKEPRTAVIQTVGIPIEAHGWIQATALDQYERQIAKP